MLTIFLVADCLSSLEHRFRLSAFLAVGRCMPVEGKGFLYLSGIA